MMRLSPLLVLGLLACQESKVAVYNTAPTVSIVSPPDGTSYDEGENIEIFGLARDDQTSSADLAILWNSSIDGDIGSTPPDVDGSLYLATASLSPGDQTITLTAVDEKGESANTSIGLHIGDGGGGGTVGNGPTITILGPTDGQVFTIADAVNLIAAVTDVEDAEESLQVDVVDVPDGAIWSGAPTSTGSVSVPLAPTPGSHVVTVDARDADGNISSASVAYSVEGDGRPTATIDAPVDGVSVSTLDTIVFRGTVSDSDTDVEALGVSWSSDLIGAFSTTTPDSSGHATVGTTLPAGVHTISLTATDELGQTGVDSIVVTVIDPNDVDDDGDGFTENGGDCDDSTGAVYPGADDQCDDLDNDCNGYVNDPYFDTYEVNDTRPGYDLGEVDAGWLWSGTTLTLSGLTLSADDDEDWFSWDADDEIYDNVSISVTASGLSGSGDYVLELYSLDTGALIDSASGSASLTVSYDGDLFDDGEDHWALRIYAATWPRNSCSSTFTVTVHS